MGGQARWLQRSVLGVGLAGLFLVLCVLAVFTVLTQQRVARSARRANAANVLSALYQDARYQVGVEQSLVREFRLSPDVSVLVERGAAGAGWLRICSASERRRRSLPRRSWRVG